MHYAHSREGSPRETWHELREHLTATAKLAEEFAASYAPGWGYWAGLWHDLGKYQALFQRRVCGDRATRVQHAIAGALHAYQWDKGRGKFLAQVIAAHHGGLKEWQHLRGKLQEPDNQRRLKDTLAGGPPSEVLGPPDLVLPKLNDQAWALWIRFLFSALVDADSLETEAWDRRRTRERIGEPLPVLFERALRFIRAKMKAAEANPGAVNTLRRMVFERCLEASGAAPGHFTLTVPTGGGKTLSALAFALRHAEEHKLRRVITVLPYTTILEQTVRSYREAIGEESVIEHHSNIEVERFDDEAEADRHREATENWDAPVIVTTSVQFLESLYASHKRRCRKLHNIANSVVVLDEVQTFPMELMKPIRTALDALVEHFGVSIVHSTATQPLLAHDQAREIIDDEAALFRMVEGRFRTVWPVGITAGAPERWSLERLRESVEQETGSVLVIVHKRTEAEQLARALGEGTDHLSARMCAAHRKVKLEEIKARLGRGEQVRLVATQLVEAGVDIDFPVVYRAMAGLDTLAQAAGRCNREGRLAGSGRLVVFWAESDPPAASLKAGRDEARLTLQQRGDVNLGDPGLFPEYFAARKRHAPTTDKGGVLEYEMTLDFPEAEKKFRMIEEAGVPVIAPYGGWKELVDAVRAQGPTRELLRRLQPYLVNLYPQEIAALEARGALAPVHERLERLWRVTPNCVTEVYSERFGFGWAHGEEDPTLIA